MASVVIPSMTILARDPQTTEFHSRGESIGLAFDTLAGIASAVASVYVLMLLCRRIYTDGWSSWRALHVSIFALFFAEFIQGIGHAIDLKWVVEGKTETGTVCTVQGLMRQLGDTYAALATMTIAVQTFVTLWWLKHLNRTTSAIIMGVEFIFVALIVGIGFGVNTRPNQKYYAAPIPYWCWLGKDFIILRIAGEYVWFWLTLLISMALYIPLFLLHRGVIKPGTSWYSPKADFTSVNSYPSGDVYGDQHNVTQETTRPPPYQVKQSHDVEIPPSTPTSTLHDVSRKDRRLWFIILYPILYCMLIMPITIVRWINITGELASEPRRWTTGMRAAIIIAMIIFSLSGVLDAALYLLTRRRFFQPDRRKNPRAPSFQMTPTMEGRL